ncbi:hypothetical protein AUC69_04435 [Methyloceanibacter superfactus]|uniref:Cyclic nucleotide-binding domain-containing protein n=1 Tax=Methyloceanibacter superfactus TaxID=1774969 RepID=A0A1E3VIW6_9HYPH|nr:hypothetical protein [Methyloceanibacter superfactus]ODR93454.1 hypothetical protein AUC69_04435 [Methyloceanibacter superfactus]
MTTQAATVRTRRGQTISLTLDGSEALYFVRSGVLMVDVTLPDDLRQVVGLLYPATCCVPASRRRTPPPIFRR